MRSSFEVLLFTEIVKFPDDIVASVLNTVSAPEITDGGKEAGSLSSTNSIPEDSIVASLTFFSQ